MPPGLMDAQRASLVTADELLMLIAGQIAAGMLH